MTGKAKVPVTLTGIGIDLLEKQWAESGYDRLRILGKELVKTKEYNKRQGYFFKKTLEKDIHPVHYGNALATDCYHGGRNEQYWFGPAFSDDWSDFDLSSAYPTAMSLIGMPDWEAMRATSRLEDFTPTALVGDFLNTVTYFVDKFERVWNCGGKPCERFAYAKKEPIPY